MQRRIFVGSLVGSAIVAASAIQPIAKGARTESTLPEPESAEDVFSYIRRLRGRLDQQLYLKILGSANEFKEGDEIVGVAAFDKASRAIARKLLAQTRLEDIEAHPPWSDQLSKVIAPMRGPKQFLKPLVA